MALLLFLILLTANLQRMIEKFMTNDNGFLKLCGRKLSGNKTGRRARKDEARGSGQGVVAPADRSQARTGARPRLRFRP
jgi:hypothetical protein